MKIPDQNGEFVEAGAYVVMREDRGWICPLCSCATMQLALGCIARLIEQDSALQAVGGIPGMSKLWVVPVVAVK